MPMSWSVDENPSLKQPETHLSEITHQKADQVAAYIFNAVEHFQSNYPRGLD